MKPISEETDLIRRLNFAAMAAWLITSIVMATIALLWYGQDFRGYYAAARVVLEGGNPYDYHALAPVLLETTGVVGNNPYFYAPCFAWFIIPWAWLPFDLARICWMSFNVLAWDLSLWQLGELLHWPRDWRRWSLCLLATLIFAWMTWRFEQTGILLFALLVSALLALRNHRDIQAGIWLALLLIKPNITLLPVAALTFWLIRHGRWKPVITMSLLTAGLLTAAFLITPDLLRPFFERGFTQGLYSTLDGPGQVVSIRVNTTLHDWLTMFHIAREIAFMISAMAFVSGLIVLGIIVWRTESINLLVIASLLINFAITPYALQYDYPLLAFVLFWAMALRRYGQKLWVNIAGTVLLLLIVSVLFWERPISDGYWLILGLIGLTSLYWYNADRSRIPSSLW